MYGFTSEELRFLRRLGTPAKIQDFLESLPVNYEMHGETCMSPRRVLRERTAHCMEGAMFAAAAFLVHGQRPLLMDLRATADDYDHVVALFRQDGRWGAISKSDHAVLRFREPIYRTIRELALSYFHEYFNDSGKKTLRSFTKPFLISRHVTDEWLVAEEDVWGVDEALDEFPHEPILTRAMAVRLRKADPIEIKVGKITQWKKV